jgi:SAM-dependent methyltransferase
VEVPLPAEIEAPRVGHDLRHSTLLDEDTMDVTALYRERFERTGLERRQRVWKTLCESFFNRRIPATATVLELACGYGEFINNIHADHKMAVDQNPDSAGHLASDVIFHNISANALASLGADVADVVFASNFLEHLHDKQECDAVLAAVHHVLRPGGQFIVMGPNIRYAYQEYWNFYDHHLPLSDLSLGEGLRLAGFRIAESIPRFLPFTMDNRRPTNDFLIKAYLAMPMAWKVLGKQFLVTAVKS